MQTGARQSGNLFHLTFIGVARNQLYYNTYPYGIEVFLNKIKI